jgi:hypothetical protein
MEADISHEFECVICCYMLSKKLILAGSHVVTLESLADAVR